MIAIHPPAYFPGLRYMALLQQVDAFVLADTFPYTRRSMQRRSRLRNPQGWQWITVPLQARQQGRPLVEAAINDDDPWTASTGVRSNTTTAPRPTSSTSNRSWNRSLPANGTRWGP